MLNPCVSLLLMRVTIWVDMEGMAGIYRYGAQHLAPSVACELIETRVQEAFFGITNKNVETFRRNVSFFANSIYHFPRPPRRSQNRAVCFQNIFVKPFRARVLLAHPQHNRNLCIERRAYARLEKISPVRHLQRARQIPQQPRAQHSRKHRV